MYKKMYFKVILTFILTISVIGGCIFFNLSFDTAADETSLTFPLKESINNQEIIIKDHQNNLPIISKYHFEDSNNNIISFGTETTKEESINKLLEQIDDGEMNASKSGCFETAEDAKEGIAKITFDIVGKPIGNDKDIIYIIDESGSMNMTMANNQSIGAHRLLSPCLNHDHYYKIPKDLGFGNTEDIYIKLSDYGDDAFNTWNDYNTTVNKIIANYHLTSLSMNTWQPWNHHYHLENGQYVHIPMATTTNKYDSPVGNTTGCFDRMMLTKDQIKARIPALLNEKTNNRVAIIGFNDIATNYIGFSSSAINVEEALSNYVGADNTKYSEGLKLAYEMINNRDDKTRAPYVVFITDGAPTDSDEERQDAINLLKSTNAKIFSVGLKVGEDSTNKVSEIASNPIYYHNAQNVGDFINYFENLGLLINNALQGTLTDIIGGNYDLLLDESHPLTIDDDQYISLASLPSSIKYDDATNNLSYSDFVVDTTGKRVSFYVKLDSKYLTTDTGIYEFLTNEEAKLEYHKLKKDENNFVITEDTPTEISMPSPKIKISYGEIPAYVVSDKMTNNDPNIMGLTLEHDETITYTITISNTKNIDVTNLLIRNPIPNDTSFVSADNGGQYIASGNYVYWKIPKLNVGESLQINFTVKVTANTKDQEVNIINEQFYWGWGTKNTDYPSDGLLPCIGNKLQNDTPVPEVGSLKIEKQVEGSGGDTLTAFNFKVTYTNLDNQEVIENFTLKSGDFKVIDNILANTPYTVEEQEANANGYTTSVENASGTIEKDETISVVFTNTREVGSLKIEKIVTGTGADLTKDFNFKLSYVDKNNVSQEKLFTLKHGQYIVVNEILAGTKYKVEEIDANQFGYTTTITNSEGTVTNGEGTIVEDQLISLVFTNEKNVGSLQIQKFVSGNAGDTNKEFNFQATYYNLNNQQVTKTFTLKSGEVEVIENILAGTNYSVKEIEANQDGYVTTMTNDTGVIEKNTQITATFNNEKNIVIPNKGQLLIEKFVIGNGAETDRYFNFTVNYVDSNNISQQLTFVLKSGESKCIDDVLVGSNYKVVEKEANSEGYVTTVENGTGTIKDGEVTNVKFYNERHVGSLKIEKLVKGSGGELNRAFNFEVTYIDVNKGEVTKQFTLKSGESIQIDDILANTTYSVKELDANKNGYTTTVTNETGTIEKDKIIVVNYINTRDAGSLRIEKNVIGNAAEINRYFSFKVTYTNLINKEVNTTILLKSGESKVIEDILPNSTYKVEEVEANQDGYTTTVQNATGTIEKDQTAVAVFENKREVGSLEVVKVVTGAGGEFERYFTFNITYTNVEGKIVSETFKLKNEETKVIENILVGTNYEVREVEANKEGYTTTVTNDKGTISDTNKVVAKFVNDRKAGSLKIEKKVVGNAGELDRLFSFKVTYTNVNNEVITKEFVLSNGSSLTIENILPESSYKVVEVEADTDGYKTTVTNAEGIIKDGQTSLVSFENKREVGSLEVEKIVNGAGAELDRYFAFEVIYFDETNQERVVTFKLKANETKLIENILVGTKYQVRELDANKDGYTTTATNEIGTIEDTSNIKVSFVNVRDAGSLEIKKEVVGNAGELEREFTFNVTYTDLTNNLINKTITLKSGESKLISDILPNSTYEVVEVEANQDGYTTTVQNATGTIEKDQTVQVIFENRREVGSLKIEKFVGGNAGEVDRSFTFKVTYFDLSNKETVKTITLKSGEFSVIENVLANTTYTVEELEANQDGYTTTVQNATGIIEQGTVVTATFINEKNIEIKPEVGQLVIEKIVKGNGGEVSRLFNFIVNYLDKDNTVQQATFALKSGEIKVIDNVLANSQYEVIEVEADQDGYLTTKINEKGTILEGEPTKVQFINTREVGSLKIEKIVTGDAGEKEREFNFIVNYIDINNEIKEASFTLKSGETKLISNILANTSYQVKEVEANQDGYTTTIKNAEGMILKDQMATATFINEKNADDSNNEGVNTSDPSFLAHWLLLSFNYILIIGSLLLIKKLKDN